MADAAPPLAFVAAGLSLLIGLTASHFASLIPCHGEGLACNLNEAIGGYAVLIWTCLGPLIFGVILLVQGIGLVFLALRSRRATS